MPGTDKNPEAEHIMDFLDTGYILPCRIPMRIPMPDTGHFQILTFLYIIY